MTLIIPSSDCEKLFAICKEMCYNIIADGMNLPKNLRKSRLTVKKTGEGGYMRPAVSFLRRAGLGAGLVVFLAACVISNGYLLGYSLGGVPLKNRGEVMQTLLEGGVSLGVRFSGIDTEEISRRIVLRCPDIGFASVYKKGNYLVVETLPAIPKSEEEEISDILSPVDGTVEKIAVLKGTPLVKKGDPVTSGEALVGGYFIAGDRVIATPPKAEIVIRGEYLFSFSAAACDEYHVSAAVAVAKEKCPFSQVFLQNVQVEENIGGYKITVTLSYLEYLGG